MKKPQRTRTAPSSEAPSTFSARPASQAWERACSPDCPQNHVWAWYKPAVAPQGLILRIPDETYQKAPHWAAQWTMRKLVQAAGVDPVAVATWCLYGVVYHGMTGTNPYFDVPIPRPPAGADPNIVVHVGLAVLAAPVSPVPLAASPVVGPALMNSPLAAAPMVMPPMRMPAVAQVPPNGVPMQALPVNGFAGEAGPSPLSAAELAVNKEAFDHIDADWTASMEIEKDLTRLRKQLLDMMGRLKSLNRDLTPQERLYATNQEKKDWLHARRCLRDFGNRCWKCIKAHDIGYTSAAGQRKWFEEIYEKHVVPRLPFDGLQQAQRAYETYRKQVQTLHSDMGNAYSQASLDGERRAQQVLGRIAEKVRNATAKKNFLGVMLDN